MRLVGLITAADQGYDVTGQTFFMNKLGLLKSNPTAAEKSKCVEHMKMLTKECAKRLLEYLYRPQEGDMNRPFWLGMARKPFLGQQYINKPFNI